MLAGRSLYMYDMISDHWIIVYNKQNELKTKEQHVPDVRNESIPMPIHMHVVICAESLITFLPNSH